MSSNGAAVVVNPLAVATASAAEAGGPPQDAAPPSSPSSRRPRKSLGQVLGFLPEAAPDGASSSVILGVPEPDWRPRPEIATFCNGLARAPVRFAIDMLLAAAPSMLTIFSAYSDSAGARAVYIDGCKTADGGVPVELSECIRCNGDSPRFGVSYPESWRPAIVAFAALSSAVLTASTYGLSLLRDRADYFLAHGVYISSAARNNWISAVSAVLYVVILSLLQVLAGESRKQDFQSATLGRDGHCVLGVYANTTTTLVPTYSPGNPTTPTSVLSGNALLVVYFILNTIIGQAFTLRSLAEGPQNLYTDASLREALKKRYTVRALQDAVRWQVRAADLDAVARLVLLELSATERPRRRLHLLRIVFTPLILCNYYGTYTSWVGCHPFDRTYRKREWGGRTMTEEVLHRLWARGCVTRFRARDKPLPPLTAPEPGDAGADGAGASASMELGPASPAVAAGGAGGDFPEKPPVRRRSTHARSSSAAVGDSSVGHAEAAAAAEPAAAGAAAADSAADAADGHPPPSGTPAAAAPNPLHNGAAAAATQSTPTFH